MQFKVPQFIDVPDKLFGPFTFFQFAYLIGGGGLIFILYKFLPLWIAIIPIVLVASLTALLVFYKINEKPFIYYLQAGIAYMISSKLYVWRQRLIKPGEKKNDEEIPTPPSVIPMASASKLKDLSWSLEVEDKNKQ